MKVSRAKFVNEFYDEQDEAQWAHWDAIEKAEWEGEQQQAEIEAQEYADGENESKWLDIENRHRNMPDEEEIFDRKFDMDRHRAEEVRDIADEEFEIEDFEYLYDFAELADEEDVDSEVIGKGFDIMNRESVEKIEAEEA
jgi:hypothetical protein